VERHIVRDGDCSLNNLAVAGSEEWDGLELKITFHSFTLHLGCLWDSVRACFKEIYMQSYFAKHVSKIALVAPRKLLIKLKKLH
jgi:hypothetical protein